MRWQALCLAVLLCLSCREGASTEGLAVDLALDRTTVGVDDTISGTIRLRNTRLGWVTVAFPNLQQAELLFFDAEGELIVRWPGVRAPMVSELRLGPLCAEEYDFWFCPRSYAPGMSPGEYRVRARPADYETPFTEKTLLLTD